MGWGERLFGVKEGDMVGQRLTRGVCAKMGEFGECCGVRGWSLGSCRSVCEFSSND